ncbi:MAG: sensor histidine kinase [Anaerolineae bacterium]
MKKIRQHLSWKLFASYVVIIIVGVVSLAVAAEFHTPSALERHMANMDAAMGGGMMGGMMADLNDNFRTAVNEILLVAALIATGTAVAVSTFVTRRIVHPIQQMKTAARRIANGRYEERIQTGGDDELAELAETFNEMAARLAETEARRRRLVGDVAHELRTPLSSIQGVMEGLEDGVLPAEPATFADVQREIRRLQRLVRDLEELSRAEAGQIGLETAVVTPSTFIRPASERLRLQFEEKGVTLTSDIPPDLPAVNVDVSRMTQVILNLLGNALQYTPSGGQVRIHCSVSNTPSLLNTDRCLLITVTDTGIGIAPEHLPHVFERFYRVDKSRARSGGGSGIGLTISKHLVDMHNGRLTASSSGSGQGSTFTIALPLP